jgi:hypothetical protein
MWQTDQYIWGTGSMITIMDRGYISIQMGKGMKGNCKMDKR